MTSRKNNNKSVHCVQLDVYRFATVFVLAQGVKTRLLTTYHFKLRLLIDSIETPNNQNRWVTFAVDTVSHDSENKNDKQGNSKRNRDQSQNYLDNRYPLNVNNYVAELHAALLKECNDNLVSFTLLNATLDYESLENVTSRTIKAVKDEKIFSVLGYFPKISEEMKNRGWIEKRNPNKHPIDYSRYSNSKPFVVNWVESPPLISSTDQNQAIWDRMKNIQSWSILKDKRSDFIFVTRKQLVHWTTLHKSTIVSQFERRSFCSKDGLIRCLEPYKNTVTNLMFPRCHYIQTEADYYKFLEDFIATALIGTMKIIVQSIEYKKRIFSENGNIPYEIIEFVFRCVNIFLNKQQDGSAEKDFWKFDSEKEMWNEFLGHYSKMVSDDNVQIDHKYNKQLESEVYAKYKHLLCNVKKYCPQHYIDGNTNTWIVKPPANCSGHGIIMSRDINTITNKIVVADYSRNNFILQKYIEKPLLVYTCKIDLRQWFLVTNMNPVVVWMYKEGYVRFCAESFSMRNMNESVHLSNVRLQMKYRKTRRPNVPEECMWDYQELKNYLSAIGQPYVWDELIFPGMSESVYAVIQAAKDITLYRVNSFQLFGADFVITENFVPYLIEINSIPGLNPSTSVIANLVPLLLGDLVKVVIDYAQDPNADTGLFVKVVPEDLNSSSGRPAAGLANAEMNPFSQFDQSAVATPNERYVKWMEDLGHRLAAIRFRINGREKLNERRYQGYYRDQPTTGVAPNKRKKSSGTAATRKPDDDA